MEGTREIIFPTYEEAANWMSCPKYFNDNDDVRKINHIVSETDTTHRRHKDFRDLHNEKIADFLHFSKVFRVGIEGLLLDEENGILWFFNHPMNGRCWSVAERYNWVRQDRRLDGLPVVPSDGSSAKTRRQVSRVPS
jgi:hypothetical protein